MNRAEQLASAFLEMFGAETGRDLALAALRLGLVPAPRKVLSERLKVDLAGLPLQNPLGIAAGLDKDAEHLESLSRMGPGFVEAGAVTPARQDGNKRPRLFRLKKDRAAINRFGFNSSGAHAAADRLAKSGGTAVIGLNIGANKDSKDRTADYVRVLELCGPHVEFATVNVSSPNTAGLRDLQRRSELRSLLAATLQARDKLPNRPKLFLKISPDLAKPQIQETAEQAVESGIDAIIATNTAAVNFGPPCLTGKERGLVSRHRAEQGGLSGKPLFELSTRVLGEIYHVTKGEVPLIGVGGIESAEDAFRKIQAGASAVQFYTALAYFGFSSIAGILQGLDDRLRNDGFASVGEAVGTDNANWRMRE